MKRNTKKIWYLNILQAFCCFVVFALLNAAGIFSAFENKTYDQRMKSTASLEPASDEIAFIMVNQESIDWALENEGWSWPWPREAYARIIEFLSAGNVKSIAFDLFFTEPSIYGHEDDLKLGSAQEASGKVIQTIFINEKNGELAAEFPISEVKETAAIIGNVTSAKDSDDIMRRSTVFYEWEGKKYPSLGFAPLYLNNQEPDLSNIPLLKDNSVYLRYRKDLNAYDPYQACDILESYNLWKQGEEGVLVPQDFEDIYVYFALYAPGLFDICSSPVSQVYPGVGVHITALDNYLTNSFIKKCPVIVELFWFLIAALLGAFIICVTMKIKSQRVMITTIILSFGVIISLLIFVPYILFTKNIWISLICPEILFVTSFLISLILGFTQEGKQKRFIKSAFSQCLAKDVVNQILDDPDSFTLGGKRYEMSAIFTDIQKFSSFSELLTASELGALLNFYLTRMSEIIMEEKGTIDKYEGDAIVALVGAPVEMNDHAIRACAAAVKMKKAETLLNQEIYEIGKMDKCPSNMEEQLFNAFKILVDNKKTLFTRIGINSGEMIAGYFGSERKKNYTMMGNNVNLASRLEGVNKQYCTDGILISEATRNLLGNNFIVRSLDKVRVMNVEKPIQLYEVLDFNTEENKGLADYVQRWEEAMVLFREGSYQSCLNKIEELAKENKLDNVAQYYIQLLSKFFVKGTYPGKQDGFGVEFLPESGLFVLQQK